MADGEIVAIEKAGGVSPQDADRAFRAREAPYAHSRDANITDDMFA